MLVAEKHQLPTNNTIKVRSMSRDDIKRTKSFLNSLVEEANKGNFSVKFPGLDKLLEEHKPVSCTHHLTSCVRTQDVRYEILSHMKAVELTTLHNYDNIFFDIALQ